MEKDKITTKYEITSKYKKKNTREYEDIMQNMYIVKGEIRIEGC